MASVQKSVLVPYSATRMFELVEHVENYPLFLPWCAGAKTLERRTGEALVRIDINYHGVRAHFTTANRSQPPELIVIELRDGPFRHLDGAWRFRALAATAIASSSTGGSSPTPKRGDGGGLPHRAPASSKVV